MDDVIIAGRKDAYEGSKKLLKKRYPDGKFADIHDKLTVPVKTPDGITHREVDPIPYSYTFSTGKDLDKMPYIKGLIIDRIHSLSVSFTSLTQAPEDTLEGKFLAKCLTELAVEHPECFEGDFTDD